MRFWSEPEVDSAATTAQLNNEQQAANSSELLKMINSFDREQQVRSVMLDEQQEHFLHETTMMPTNSTITTATSATMALEDNQMATLATAIQSVNYSLDNSDLVNVTREYPVDYATVMFGYIMPFVLLLTMITNTLVIMVLYQRHMRTPTNIVLLTMAIVDLLTLVAPSPWYFYIYTLGYPVRFLYPSAACYTHHIMTDVIPVFFHTSSIWLALLLASQRYIYVCHPTLARTWCTVPRVRKAIVIILVIAFLHQFTRFFDNTFTTVEVIYDNSTRRDLACKNAVADWVNQIDIAIYYQAYFTFRILFVFVIPCTALITLNYLLFRALRRAENKRTELLKTKFKLVSQNDKASNAKYLHNKNNSVIGTYDLTKEQSSYAINNSQSNLNTNTNGINENNSTIDNHNTGVRNDGSVDNLDFRNKDNKLVATNNNRQQTHNQNTKTTPSRPQQLPNPRSLIGFDLIQSNKERHTRQAISETGAPSRDHTSSEWTQQSVAEAKDDKTKVKRTISREAADDDELLRYDQDEDEDEDEDESTCPECAAYNRTTGNDDECHRCFVGADEGGVICDRNEHSQHKAISQCSSLMGGATNNTLTIEDISSCLATQNASSSMFANQDDDVDHNGRRNNNNQDDDGESIRLDEIDRDETVDVESRSQSQSSSSSSSSSSFNNLASNSSAAGDSSAKRKLSKDCPISGNINSDNDKSQQFAKSGSVDSRLVCGCLTARAKVKRRLRLLSSRSCDSRRACGKYCRSVSCQNKQPQSNEQSSGELATTTTNVALPLPATTTTAKHDDHRMAKYPNSPLVCNKSDSNMNEQQTQQPNGTDGTESFAFKKTIKHCKLPSSKSDNFNQMLVSKRDAEVGGLVQTDRSRGSRFLPINGGSVDRRHRRAIRDNEDADSIHEQQVKLFGEGSGGGGSQSKIGTTAATTITTTATTTTTLYSVNTNNSTNSLSQHQQPQQQQPMKQQQLEMPSSTNDNSSLKMNYHGLIDRVKSPSFASCTTGRGSRTTLIGSGGGGGAHSNAGGPTKAIPLIVSTNFATTQPATSTSVRTMDSNRTTLMLIVVVTVFLIVEVPVAIVTIAHVVFNTFDAFRDVEFSTTLNYIKLFTNFFIMISYSINFTIYCSMSKKFRETFRDLILCGARARRRKLRTHNHRSSYQAQNSQYATTIYNHHHHHHHQPHSQAAQFSLANQQATTVPVTTATCHSSTLNNNRSCLSTVQNDFNTTSTAINVNLNTNSSSTNNSGSGVPSNNLKTNSNNHLLAANLMRFSSFARSAPTGQQNQIQENHQHRQHECEL